MKLGKARNAMGLLVSLCAASRMASDAAHAGTPGCPEAGMVVGQTKISQTTGGFMGSLDPQDRFGTSIASVGDIDGDGLGDFAVGALSDDDGGTDRGAVYILFMNMNGTVRAQQKVSSTVGGFSGPLDNGDSFGVSVCSPGDLDTDGIPDLAVGASGDDDGGVDRGAIYILFMNQDGTVRAQQKVSSTSGGFGLPLLEDDRFGSSVAPMGDLDGDGVYDLAASAWLDDDGGQNRGAVYVLFMNRDGTVRAQQKISSTAGGLSGSLNNGDQFGRSLSAIGSLDGDSVTELAVGAYLDDEGGTDRGAVYILFLNSDGTVRAQQKISSTVEGFGGMLDNGDWFGASVSSLGDLDGDGIADLAAGADLDDDGGQDRGALYVLLLDATGAVRSVKKLSSTAGGFVGPLNDGDRFGHSASAAVDQNGDGVREIAVGSVSDDDGGMNQGAVWILSLADCNTFPTLLQNPTPCAVLLPASGGSTGFSITATGDGTLTYQWRKDGVALINGGPISGANSPNLTVNATAAEVGLYDCVVTNPFGSVTSAAAVLALRPSCPGDVDSSGGVNFLDITTVLANFGIACP
jgi:hypothetical protein